MVVYSSDIKIISETVSLRKNSDIPKDLSDLMDFPCPAAESQQSSLNTQLAQAVSQPVEIHGNNLGTGPEEPVSRYPRRTHKPPDRFIDSQHSLN